MSDGSFHLSKSDKIIEFLFDMLHKVQRPTKCGQDSSHQFSQLQLIPFAVRYLAATSPAVSNGEIILASQQGGEYR